MEQPISQGAQSWIQKLARLVPHASGKLFRKYVALLMGLVGSVLLGSSAIEAYSSYQENRIALVELQREKANGAAAVIDRFVKEIESQIGWTTHLSGAPGAASLEQQRFDLLRLLRQAPAITEVTMIDGRGREQLKVSRLAMDVIGSQVDFSEDERFIVATKDRRYVSPVYFRNESEPYMTVAVAGRGSEPSVTIAEVNLKFIWDVVSAIKIGKEGAAYVIDRNGLLIAHPDIGLVLRKTDLSKLDYVAQMRKAVLANPDRVQVSAPSAIGTDWAGREVLTASAQIKPLGWLVLVDLPIGEALLPLRNSLWRTALVAVGALVLAGLSAMWLARRMAVPIQALATGAARMGSGDLNHRISLKTGDEIEDLAVSFNDMGARLEESYSDLELKVEQRTAELARALEEITEKSHQLEVASQHKSQFLANMSHELRTPLNAILGYAELLVDGTYGEMDERKQGVLERVEKNGKHLLSLINDVLDLSKIEAGEMTMANEEYSLASLVRTVIASTEPLATQKGLTLVSEITDAMPMGIGDSRRLTQVLVNLVGNAIKFTETGSVTVKASHNSGEFHIDVCDTGSGIAQEDVDRIFEKFQQVDNSSTRKIGGSGLGLAIAKEFIEIHGGSIRASSQIGQGSTFTITLPVAGLQPEASS